jgi:large subunit ribosomal protein L24
VPRSKRTPEQRRRVALRHEGWAAGHARPLDIRSGDTVLVLTGRDAGKRGTVERILVDEQRIVISGVNVLKRHTRAGVRGNVQGGIVDFDAPVAYSNVMLVCPRCDKPTRIGNSVDSAGQRVPVCKRCGEIIQRSKS